MFSLIISIISIALVAALAAATVYFGGAAFNKGSAGADASTFINAGQQVAGAFTLASADGFTVATVEGLNDGTSTNGEIYLAQVPTYKGSALTTFDATETNYITLAGVSGQVCDEINKRSHGNNYVFATVKAAGIEGLYGCVGGADVDAVGQAFYKVK
jgi:hypothetical protein